MEAHAITPMIRDILKQIDYPQDVLVLDCETYFDSEYSLDKLSTWEYVTDPRFELLGVAIKQDTCDAVFVPGDIFHPPINDDLTVVMHNAPFDCLVMQHLYGFRPKYVIDTLDLARHLEPRWSNKLSVLCKRHGLKSKGETKQFLGVYRADLEGDVLDAMTEYATNDVERTYDLLNILLPLWSNAKTESRVAEYTRSIFLMPTLEFDFRRANSLKAGMQDKIAKAMGETNLTAKELAANYAVSKPKIILHQGGFSIEQIRSNTVFEAALKQHIPENEIPYKIGKKGKILALAKTDPGLQTLLAHPNEQVRSLIEARQAVKSWPLHIKRIDRMANMAKAADERMPVPLKYCGAHSGRWSGTESINHQNLASRGDDLIVAVRTVMVAPDGYKILTIDLSQIEARVLAWLAGQNDLLQAFADGHDPYIAFASRMVGMRIRKTTKDDSPEVAEWHSHQRTKGKVAVLGCGYGMGVRTCMEFAKNTYGVDLDLPTAKNLIESYRKQNQKIVQYWDDVEKLFIRACLGKGPYALRQVSFSREGPRVCIQLPSSRKLYYHDIRMCGTEYRPRVEQVDPRSKDRRAVINIYGGILVENIVQATARDILAEAILKVRDLGLDVPLTVHDDAVVLTPEDQVDVFRTTCEDIFTTPPAWAEGLPLAMESKITDRVEK